MLEIISAQFPSYVNIFPHLPIMNEVTCVKGACLTVAEQIALEHHGRKETGLCGQQLVCHGS